MKKSARLFFITLGIVIAGLSVISCNSAVKDELGTVVLDFGGSSRALDSNGLPVLSNSRILIKGEGSLSGSFSKEFSSAQGITLSFPVGDAVRLTVSVLTPSARWSSAPVSFTVESGTNALSVKLSKKISGLNNLLFTRTKSGTSVPVYNLTLYMDGKTIIVPQSYRSEHVVARDSKGRVYVRYQETGNAYKLVRYTSEGDGPADITIPPAITNISSVMNDFTKGVSYVIDPDNAVYQVKGNAVYGSGLPPLDNLNGPAAIDNERVVWLGYNGSDIFGKISLAHSVPSGSNIRNHIKIKDCKDSEITDIFIRGDYVYVLFKTVNTVADSNAPNLCSLGGVVRYNINDVINNAADNPVKIGFDDDPEFENGMLEDYDYSENFYGAVKVIGFDDENLYIADDGFDAAYLDGRPHIVKNRNRIATLNMNTNELTFTDAGPAKWYNEWKEWTGIVDTKLILWKKTPVPVAVDVFDYYQTEHASDTLPSQAFSQSDVKSFDLFCYDASGNLYIAAKDSSGDNKLCRYTLNDDGSYASGVVRDIYAEPEAMAVSVSSVAENSGKTVLFYYKAPSGSSGSHAIKRITWPTDDFNKSTPTDDMELTDLAANDTVTAIAASREGVFVAVKTEGMASEKYKIEVRKYAHQRLGGGSGNAVATVSVVGETSTAYRGTVENLNALYIQDGVLYGLTTKELRNEPNGAHGPEKASISGKLWKIGKTDSDFGGSAQELYSSEPTTSPGSDADRKKGGEFAPYRFIAIKPKKLVIASDGFYGYMGTGGQKQVEQYNYIWTFELKADGSIAGSTSVDKGADITFSKSLKNDSYFNWE